MKKDVVIGALSPAVVAEGKRNLASTRRDESAAALSDQWLRAKTGHFEIIKFGAMMMMAECNLPRETAMLQKGGWNAGTGLKAWLALNCPEINYKTAMGYKKAAESFQKMVALPEDLPLLPLMEGGVEAAAEPYHEKIMETLANVTFSALKNAAPSKKAGRKALADGGTAPVKTLPASAFEREKMMREAFGEILRALDKLLAGNRWEVLPIEDRKAFAQALKDHANTLY